LINCIFYFLEVPKVAVGLESQVNEKHLWCGRKVKVIDGSTVSMPDTPLNQQEYPQPNSQKTGCGFPLAKIGVLFSIATGAAIALVIDIFNTHDIKLARRLYSFLSPGDVLLGDRAFCAYADLFQIKTLGCDAVFRKHQSRKTQMRRGKIVGDCDKFVTWSKPKQCPQGLSQEEFNSLPDRLIVREIYFYIFIPGFRTEQVSLITTLLDTQAYSTLDITSLYQERWDVEINLRHLKTTLGMDILRSKTPAMVRKEIWAFLLAYNLLRTLMWSAGNSYGVSPLRLSLQGTRQHFHNFISQLITATTSERHQIYHTLLKVIVHKEVPLRPARSEPRVRKRRPKFYPLMQEPRNYYHHNLKTA
uniref:IS4 family transposase n=1 Tax=uncultured Nostoc sp. TaxID=340711 RepID=UPI0035CBCA16